MTDLSELIERVSDERLEELDNSACDQIARHPDGLWSDMSATEAHTILTELQSLRSAREAEPEWFAVQSVTGAHIGMWRERKIAERVFREEYPDGKFIPLFAHPSPSTEGLGVRVKGLEWRKYRNGDAGAVTHFGDIYTAYASGYWRVTRNGKTGRFIDANGDIEAAKAAAQADYERRILSALSTSVEQVESQPMECAPHDRPILVWWPIVLIDEETGDLTDTEVDGAWLVTEWNGGDWLEPDVLNALNSAAFDDDREYDRCPRCWRELPAALSPIPDNQVEG